MAAKKKKKAKSKAKDALPLPSHNAIPTPEHKEFEKKRKPLFGFLKRKPKEPKSEENQSKKPKQETQPEKKKEEKKPVEDKKPLAPKKEVREKKQEIPKPSQERVRPQPTRKKGKRSPALVFILSIVTLGIYVFYWFFVTAKELKENDSKAPSPALVFLFFIPIINFIFILIFLQKLCTAISRKTSFSPFLLFILFFIPPFGPFVSQVQLNKATDSELTRKIQALSTPKKVAKQPSEVQKKQEKKFSLTDFIEDQKRKNRERKQNLKSHVLKAGIEIDPYLLSKIVFRACIAITFFATLYMLPNLGKYSSVSWFNIGWSLFVLWTFGFFFILIGIWLLFYVVIDVRIYKRKVEIEEIFPDFLQLTASNIKAGMTIDRALWFAVRPNFGVLAHEIEIVAKETMAGKDLKLALIGFAKKYESDLLERAVSLLIEGMESGGEIGDLLNKIATNLEDQKIMIQEMAANVTTYVIFITFASIIAAPGLFALSGALIDVLNSITGQLADSGSVNTSGFALSFSGSGVTAGDFKIFAMVSLTITATLSAMIVSMIKKGNIRDGAKNIPIFIMVSLCLYFFASIFAGKFLNVFF